MTLFRRTASMTFGLVCISGLVGFRSAEAASITPTSYSYTNGTPAGDSFPYDDPTNTKLTDGLTGTTATGDGSWVGWQAGGAGAAQITFNFGSSVTITDVSIDFLRQNGGGVQLPENVQIASTVFPTTNFSTDATKGFVDYAGSWTGNQLVVTLEYNFAQHWVFANEVTFNSSSSSPTPEPGTVALALTGLVAVVGWGRRRNYFTR